MTRGMAYTAAGLGQAACAMVAALNAPVGWRMTVFFGLMTLVAFTVVPPERPGND